MRLSKKQQLLLGSLLASSKINNVKGFRGQEATIPELYVKESYPINSSPNISSMYLNTNNNKQLNLYSKKSQVNKQLFNQILEYRRSHQNKSQKKNRRNTKQKQKAIYKNPSFKPKRTGKRYGNTVHIQRKQPKQKQKQKGRRK